MHLDYEYKFIHMDTPIAIFTRIFINKIVYLLCDILFWINLCTGNFNVYNNSTYIITVVPRDVFFNL